MNNRMVATILASVALLSACAGLGRIPRAITTHDFGTPSAVSYRPAVPLRLIEVRSPSWLGSSAMQYRFADSTDQRRLVFLENRWAAAPNELISGVLRRALTLVRPQGGGCVLRVEIDEFSQIFDGPAHSHALLEARTLVVSPRGDAVVAERRMTHRVPAESATAGGGAVALREATLQLSKGIHEWLATLDRSAGGELQIADLCR